MTHIIITIGGVNKILDKLQQRDIPITILSCLNLIAYMMFHLNESKLDVSALNTKVILNILISLCLSKILEVVTLFSFFLKISEMPIEK